jgi:hypothetical protein
MSLESKIFQKKKKLQSIGAEGRAHATKVLIPMITKFSKLLVHTPRISIGHLQLDDLHGGLAKYHAVTLVALLPQNSC